MCKVSVIVPAYNAEKYIGQCIDSILAQTLEGIELIIIDDGSTDHTGEILDQMYGHLKNVKVIHQQNRGLYATRKVGLNLAKGEYVGWVDADDFISPKMYEVLYESAKIHNSDLVICDYQWYPTKVKTKEKWFREYKGIKDATFVERNSQPWNKIVKRSLLTEHCVADCFETCFDEIFIKILILAERPITINQELYYYRVGDGTMSSTYNNPAHYKRFITASENLRDEMKNVVDSKYWHDYFDYRIDYYRLMTMIVSANAGDRTTYNKIRKELISKKPPYYRNYHFRRILGENYGVLKSLVIRKVIPLNYEAAHCVCKLAFR